MKQMYTLSMYTSHFSKLFEKDWISHCYLLIPHSLAT